MMWLLIIIGIVCVVLLIAFIRHQRKLRLRAHLMQEAIRNRHPSTGEPERGGIVGAAHPCTDTRDDERNSAHHQYQPVIAEPFRCKGDTT